MKNEYNNATSFKKKIISCEKSIIKRKIKHYNELLNFKNF